MTQKLVLALAALTMTGGLALAEMAEGPWTVEQLRVVYPDLTDDDFVRIDADRDSSVTQDELDAAVAAGVVPAPEG
jgi:hypothetical protein